MTIEYDHHGGQPVDLPVGTRVLIAGGILGPARVEAERDDDGWRNVDTDTYLHQDIEEYDFDLIALGSGEERPFPDPDTTRDRQLDEWADSDAES